MHSSSMGIFMVPKWYLMLNWPTFGICLYLVLFSRCSLYDPVPHAESMIQDICCNSCYIPQCRVDFNAKYAAWKHRHMCLQFLQHVFCGLTRTVNLTTEGLAADLSLRLRHTVHYWIIHFFQSPLLRVCLQNMPNVRNQVSPVNRWIDGTKSEPATEKL